MVPEFDLGRVLQSIDNEEIIIPVDGKRKRMTRAEIHLRRLFTQAIEEDLSGSAPPCEDGIRIFGTREQRQIRSAMYQRNSRRAKRFGRNWQRKVQEYNVRARGW